LLVNAKRNQLTAVVETTRSQETVNNPGDVKESNSIVDDFQHLFSSIYCTYIGVGSDFQ